MDRSGLSGRSTTTKPECRRAAWTSRFLLITQTAGVPPIVVNIADAALKLGREERFMVVRAEGKKNRAASMQKGCRSAGVAGRGEYCRCSVKTGTGGTRHGRAGVEGKKIGAASMHGLQKGCRSAGDSFIVTAKS